jgi:NAD(P)-dependent dehydrogenase (short-subunit alcohol dehydrogenase family)
MKDARFGGKVAIVTGAGQGIGREIARQLCLGGARVAVNDEDESLAAEAAGAIAAEARAAASIPGGVAAAPFPADIADVETTRDLVRRTVSSFGRLDFAVANAGITLYGDFLDYDPADFDRLLAVNLRGSFFLAQAAARQLRTQGAGGRILFLSSVTGHVAIRQLTTYGMTKAALEALARNLSLEVAALGITVNALAPGATLTPRTAASPGWEEAWTAATPSGRVATVGDVARAALFLLSDDAAHVTGQTLVVDGGWTSMGAAPGVFDPPGTEKVRP